MALAFNVSKYYNEDAFFDITIKFGDREIKCHKMVLCAGSDYFKALCGPDSRFEESGQASIELKDDEDLDAVEAVLLYLYNIDYTMRLPHVTDDPSLHLSVCSTATKYLVPMVKAQAIGNLQLVIDTKAMDAGVVLELLEKHENYRGQDHYLDDIITDLAVKHMGRLMTLSGFRALLDTNPSLLKLVVDRVELASGLEDKAFIRCLRCGALNDWGCSECDSCGVDSRLDGPRPTTAKVILWVKRS